MNPLHMPSFAPRFYPLGPERRDRARTAIVGVGGNSVRGGAGPGGGRAGAGRGRGPLCHHAWSGDTWCARPSTWLQVGHHLARLQDLDGRSTGP
jgi:hypothetical protein